MFTVHRDGVPANTYRGTRSFAAPSYQNGINGPEKGLFFFFFGINVSVLQLLLMVEKLSTLSPCKSSPGTAPVRISTEPPINRWLKCVLAWPLHISRLHFFWFSGAPQILPGCVSHCCGPEMWLCDADLLVSPCGHCEFVVPLSPEVILLQECPSACILQELILHCVTRNKQLERQNNMRSAALPCLSWVFPYTLLTLLIYPLKMSCIFPLLHRVSLLNPSLLPPPLRKLSFHYAGSSIQRMPVLHKKILPLCSSFYTSFLLSGWRDLDFSKCQNPLSGWLSDQAPRWS